MAPKDLLHNLVAIGCPPAGREPRVQILGLTAGREGALERLKDLGDQPLSIDQACEVERGERLWLTGEGEGVDAKVV